MGRGVGLLRAGYPDGASRSLGHSADGSSEGGGFACLLAELPAQSANWNGALGPALASCVRSAQAASRGPGLFAG